MLKSGYIPVISTVGYDSFGNVYNINADTAASVIAGALQAESMILMTDIRGLLEDKNDEKSLIKKVYVSDIPSLIKQGIISGGMIPKIECCKEAIRRGVKKYSSPTVGLIIPFCGASFRRRNGNNVCKR